MALMGAIRLGDSALQHLRKLGLNLGFAQEIEDSGGRALDLLTNMAVHQLTDLSI